MSHTIPEEFLAEFNGLSTNEIADSLFLAIDGRTPAQLLDPFAVSDHERRVITELAVVLAWRLNG